MEILQEVATISGKPGLFRIVKPGRAGVIVETLDAEKKREMVSANARVSVLKEISVYTTDFNVSKPLGEVFMAVKELHPTTVDLDLKKATTNELFAFFEKIMPDFDKERVYPTDIKKIISWYNALSVNLPEAFIPSEAAS
jgi:hypothetical protein